MMSRRCGRMRVLMKLIKRVFFGLVGLVLVACLIILICALNPSLTQSLAKQVQSLQQNIAPGASGTVTAGDPRGEGVLPEPIPGINVNWLANRETEGYLVPTNMPDDLPPEVSGLVGYEPITGQSQEIVQEEADNLSSVLGGGELDVEFLLPDSFYPYYLMLEPELKLLYVQIYANALAQVISFVPVVDVNVDQVDIAFEAVINDHPELTLIETSYSCLYLEDGTCVEMTLDYNELLYDSGSRLQQYYNKAMEIVLAADALGSDFEKVKYVHNRLAELVEYDMNAPFNQVAYSAIANQRTVCAGYARAFQLVMQELGIPCFYCTGFAGEEHAWNIVKLGGKYYNIDVTWDDMDPLNYDYFNKTDAEFSDTHVRTGLSVYLPACTGTLYNGNNLDDLDKTDQNDASGDGQDGGTDGDQPAATARPTLEHPLTWTGRGGAGNQNTADDEHQKNLDKAGIDEEDVLDTLQKYFDDCEEQLKTVGVGDKQFDNVVPKSLWSTVEGAYSNGSYWKGYVDDALEELKVENFVIQIQVIDLGGGYYRVYHNVLTY